MSLSWKFLPLAAVAVLGAMAILPGGVTHPTTASAAFNCDDSNTITVKFMQDDEVVNVEGFSINIAPNPRVDPPTGSLDIEDGDKTGSNKDDDGEVNGQIVINDACDGASDDHYTVTAGDLPGDCDFSGDDATVSGGLVDASEDSIEFTATSNRTVTFLLQDCELPATAVPTTGAAATVVAQASPNTVSCNGTSIVTIQVKTAGGTPVAVGTQVTIQANIGQVSPSSGQTTSADGSVFVFYTAPSNQGGAATITAKAGNAQGTATVTVNCNAAPTATTAPPPTVNPGSISPPNTGDAGLANGSSDSWIPFAGIAAIVATLAGGLALVVRNRN
jgi:hypothetical protein